MAPASRLSRPTPMRSSIRRSAGIPATKCWRRWATPCCCRRWSTRCGRESRHGATAAMPARAATTRALLKHWFRTEHLMPQADGTVEPFQWYFAQREAVESAIWLYEVERARDPYALMKI